MRLNGGRLEHGGAPDDGFAGGACAVMVVFVMYAVAIAEAITPAVRGALY
jgi:hypothetical protein